LKAHPQARPLRHRVPSFPLPLTTASESAAAWSESIERVWHERRLSSSQVSVYRLVVGSAPLLGTRWGATRVSPSGLSRVRERLYPPSSDRAIAQVDRAILEPAFVDELQVESDSIRQTARAPAHDDWHDKKLILRPAAIA